MYLIKNKHLTVANSKNIVGEKALVAQSNLPRNTVIFLHQSQATNVRTRTSIQVSENKHVEVDDFGAFTNHSCSPNSQIIANYDDETNLAEVLLITISEVKQGEEITFDYATTETEVTPDLHNKRCLCGAEQCRKQITGFNNLPLCHKMRLLASNLTANYLQLAE